MAQLDTAKTVVTEEIERLEHHSDTAFNSVNRLFEELAELLEKKRLEMISEVRRRKTEKVRVLEEQLQQIQSEKSGVATDLTSCKSNYLELRLREARIRDLNAKLETIRSGQVCLTSLPKHSVCFQETFRAAGEFLPGV